MKNILSEITEQEKNRILEMHKTATSKFYLSEQETTGLGHLTGQYTQDLGEITADPSKTLNWEWTLNNTGEGPISIKEVKTFYGVLSDPNNIQTVQPGQSIKIKVSLPMGNFLQKGIIEFAQKYPEKISHYEQSGVFEFEPAVILIVENGRKQKYQLNPKVDLKGQFKI